MIDIIILTLLLVLIQIWLLPMLLNLKNLDFCYPIAMSLSPGP
jgi:hypothetical protein